MSRAKLLTWDDVEVGSLLGSGAFASVYSSGCKSLSELNVSPLTPNRTLFKYHHSDSALTAATVEESEHDDDHQREGTRPQQQTFALKRIRNELPLRRSLAAVQGLVSEAALLARLPEHPNIIRLMGCSTKLFSKDPRKGFVILERMTRTLDTCLLQEESNARDRVEFYGRDLASALCFLHNHQVMHRDVKPDNLGVAALDGRLRLFDFGSARVLESDGLTRNLTKALGTPRYRAPEIKSGEYGLSVDVYSFAMVLWYIVTLQRPYDQLQEPELSKTIMSGSRPDLDKVSNCGNLIACCWSHRPAERPTMEAVLSDNFNPRDEVGQADKAPILTCEPSISAAPWESSKSCFDEPLHPITMELLEMGRDAHETERVQI